MKPAIPHIEIIYTTLVQAKNLTTENEKTFLNCVSEEQAGLGV